MSSLLSLIAYCFSVTGNSGNGGIALSLSAVQLKLNKYNERGARSVGRALGCASVVRDSRGGGEGLEEGEGKG